MPKAANSGRAKLHAKAAKLSKQKSQADELVDATATSEITAVASNSDTKGKKRATFHEQVVKTPSMPFATSLASGTPHPYLQISKSSRKRLNRRNREHLSGGSLTAVGEALGELIDTPTNEKDLEDAETHGSNESKKRKKKSTEDGGKIGQGKGRTLKEKQRKEQV